MLVTLTRAREVYHGTRTSIADRPTIMDGFAVHVGGRATARARIEHTAKLGGEPAIWRARLRPCQVLDTNDCGLWNHPYWVTDTLAHVGLERMARKSDDQWARVRNVFGLDRSSFSLASAFRASHPDIYGFDAGKPDEASRRRMLGYLRDSLVNLGIDAVRYRNKFEAPGSVSYAILRPEVVDRWSCESCPSPSP